VAEETQPARQTPVAAPPPLKLEWPSDLVQIETDPQKVAAVAESPQSEGSPVPGRVRPTPPPVSSDEPLVQVETR